MKATKLLVAGLAIMSAGFGLSGSVDAARSTAEVAITPGNLTLETVPNMKFTDVTIAAIAAADVTTPLLNGNLTVADPSSQGDDSMTTTVGDYRGAGGTGWTLSAELAPFIRTGGGEQFLGTMSVAPTSLTFDGTIEENIVIGGASTLLATADPGQGLGISDFVFSAGNSNTLTIPKQADIIEGVYQAAMTWTLTATP